MTCWQLFLLLLVSFSTATKGKTQIVEWSECPEQTELRRRCGRLRFSRSISKRVWSPEPPVDTSAAHRWPTLVWTRLQFSRSNSKCSWTKGLLRSTSSCIRDAPPWQRGASLVHEEVDLRGPLVQLHLLQQQLLLLNCNLVQTRVGHRCAAEASTGGCGLQTLLLILLLNLNLPHLLLLNSVCSGHSDHSTI